MEHVEGGVALGGESAPVGDGEGLWEPHHPLTESDFSMFVWLVLLGWYDACLGVCTGGECVESGQMLPPSGTVHCPVCGVEV